MPATSTRPDGEGAVHWRCFHCGETFTKEQECCALEHFGITEVDLPVCLMRLPGEYHLLRLLRQAQEDLVAYRAEDTELHRAIHAIWADYGANMRDAEEKGYSKALADLEAGKIEPEHATRIVNALFDRTSDEPRREIWQALVARGVGESPVVEPVQPQPGYFYQDNPIGNATAFILCSDCPPNGYPTNITRCVPCPRRDHAHD